VTETKEKVMAEYYLHVELIVPETQTGTFEAKVKEFLERDAPRAAAAGEKAITPFKFFDPSFDLELLLALKTPEAFKFSGYEAYQSAPGQFEKVDRRQGLALARRYVHLWRLNSLSQLDIARIMNRSADDVLYTEIDAQVVRETQNLVLRVQWLDGLPSMNAGKGRFARVIRNFLSKDLGTYLFKVGALFSLLAEKNYRTLGHFQNVSGELDTVVEFWQTPDDEKLQTMVQVLQGVTPTFKAQIVDDFEKLSQAEVREAFIPAPYFPRAR
jgi:hypothetical protein